MVPLKFSWTNEGGLENNSNGSALLIVLLIIFAGGVVVAVLFGQSFQDLKRWEKAKNELKALYLAESGIAHLLYLEHHPDDNKEIEKLGSEAEEVENAEEEELSEPFQLLLNSSLPSPEMTASVEGAFLLLQSSATIEGVTVNIQARFGRGLSDPMFAPALVLSGSSPIASSVYQNVEGEVKVAFMPPTGSVSPKQENGGGGSIAVQNVNQLAISYATKKREALHADYSNNLTGEAGKGGNGEFNDSRPPQFDEEGKVIYPMGDITIENSGRDCFKIVGPGQFFAHGDIYIKGCVVLENIQLFAGKDIHFQDSVSSFNLVTYSVGSTYILDQSNLDIQSVSERNIVLEGTSQTSLSSSLISMGHQKMDSTASDTSKSGYGIILKAEAVGRGLLISTGLKGYVSIGTRGVVEGLVLSNNNVWNSGVVKGIVMTKFLKCEESEEEHCLGDGQIFRSMLPRAMVLPVDFGEGLLSNRHYRIIDWVLAEKRSDE